jgi:hypothetical protein
MLNLDIKSAHRMVREQRAADNDVWWEGWTIHFFRPAEHAMHSTDGIFRKGEWGFDNRVEVNSEGIWEVDPRNVKRIRHSRSRR